MSTAGREIGRELKTMSKWPDARRGLLGLVTVEPRRRGLGHFRAGVWSAVVANKLALAACLEPA